jgi:hypothetical protein
VAGVDVKTIGDICGDCSFLGDIAIQQKMHYKTWVTKEAEMQFVDIYLWDGER